jgi:hypothetical protein
MRFASSFFQKPCTILTLTRSLTSSSSCFLKTCQSAIDMNFMWCFRTHMTKSRSNKKLKFQHSLIIGSPRISFSLTAFTFCEGARSRTCVSWNGDGTWFLLCIPGLSLSFGCSCCAPSFSSVLVEVLRGMLSKLQLGVYAPSDTAGLLRLGNGGLIGRSRPL